MALTITIASLKGGVGKTTLSLNLGMSFHGAGHRTLIVDTDPQGTCRVWSAKAAEFNRDGPPVVSIEGKALRRDLKGISKGFDVVIIDTPPRMAVEARAAMLAADIVLMPILPGPADVWALSDTIDVFGEAQSLRPELTGVAVINRNEKTVLSRMVQEAINDLGVPTFKTTLGNRVAFGEATLAGTAVPEYAPSSVASQEIQSLLTETLDEIRKAAHG